MRAHEHAEEQSAGRPRRRSSSGAGHNPEVTRMLSLQNSVGNAALSADLSVQRVETDEEEQQETPRRPRRAADRERQLSQAFGIRIGPDGRGPHFTHSMLDHIEAALRNLPLEDLGPNEHLVAIELDESAEGSTSEYREDDQSVAIVRPVLMGGVRAPQWLYARMNRGNAWQRRRMDQGAMSAYPGVSRAGDRALGVRSGDREVMGGVSNALAHGNLVEWTVMHEVGHSVDVLTAWQRDLAHEERFGGWQVYDDSEALDRVAEAILAHAGLNTVNPAGHERAVTTLTSMLRPTIAATSVGGANSRLDRFLQRYQSHLDAPTFAARSATVTAFVRLALAQPWTLPDGGASVLDVNGRTFQVDPYNTWVSYLTDQRTQHALSNYQFSNPREWFAEAYAAYHDPQPGVRGRLRADVQAWFATLPRQRPTE